MRAGRVREAVSLLSRYADKLQGKSGMGWGAFGARGGAAENARGAAVAGVAQAVAGGAGGPGEEGGRAGLDCRGVSLVAREQSSQREQRSGCKTQRTSGRSRRQSGGCAMSAGRTLGRCVSAGSAERCTTAPSSNCRCCVLLTHCASTTALRKTVLRRLSLAATADHCSRFDLHQVWIRLEPQ